MKFEYVSVTASDEVLVFEDGKVQLSVLEKILEEAAQRKLGDDVKIKTTVRAPSRKKYCEGDILSYPLYRTIGSLRGLYSSNTKQNERMLELRHVGA